MFNSAKKTTAGVAALAALGLGGSALANAATSSGSTSRSGSGAKAPPQMPAHGTPAHEDAEKAVTGNAATKAQAAAVRSVGSGTAGPVTTDYFGNGYEVVVTKSDGTRVEVHLDGSFKVIQGPPGGHGGPPPGGAPPPGHAPGGRRTGAAAMPPRAYR